MTGRRGGFTMMELMLVMMVGAILTAIALPRINVARARAESSARSVRIALVAAQQRAVLRQHDVVVEFDAPAGLLRFYDDRNRSGSRDEGEQMWAHPLEDGLTFGRGQAPVGPPGSESVAFDEGDSGLPELVFHRSGSASAAGGFYVSSPRAATSASHLDEAFAISVARATGRVRMLRVIDGAWQESY